MFCRTPLVACGKTASTTATNRVQLKALSFLICNNVDTLQRKLYITCQFLIDHERTTIVSVSPAAGLHSEARSQPAHSNAQCLTSAASAASGVGSRRFKFDYYRPEQSTANWGSIPGVHQLLINYISILN